MRDGGRHARPWAFGRNPGKPTGAPHARRAARAPSYCGRGVRLEAAAPKAANPSSIIMPTPGSQQPTLTRQEGDLPEPRVAQQYQGNETKPSQGGGIDAERLVNARIAEGFAPRFCPLVDFSSSRTLRGDFALKNVLNVLLFN